jgi:hypothetical protein
LKLIQEFQMANGHGGSRPGSGRPKGRLAKETADIKVMVIEALRQVGGIDYLAARAIDTPASFMALLGKILPTQITGENGAPIAYSFRWADATLPEDNAEPVVSVKWIEADAAE